MVSLATIVATSCTRNATMRKTALSTILLNVAATATTTAAFSAGKGFGSSPQSSNAFVSFDRFRASCPAPIDSIRQFDQSLIKVDDNIGNEDDVWVAVYRSANNLPSVFVRDAFFDAMRISTTQGGQQINVLRDVPRPAGDAETLVSSSSKEVSIISPDNDNSDEKPVAVARLCKDEKSAFYIIDSMRCILKKENTDADCDGGSEHAEAIGVCIDELVLSYLQLYLENEGDSGGKNNDMTFDGGIHFRGTLVSGTLLDSRGFREVTELSADMHSHESDYDGALAKYAERSTSKEVAKNPGARDRALKIVSCLGRIDRDEDMKRAGRDVKEEDGDDDGEDESDFDPWASVKRYL